MFLFLIAILSGFFLCFFRFWLFFMLFFLTFLYCFWGWDPHFPLFRSLCCVCTHRVQYTVWGLLHHHGDTTYILVYHWYTWYTCWYTVVYTSLLSSSSSHTIKLDFSGALLLLLLLLETQFSKNRHF